MRSHFALVFVPFLLLACGDSNIDSRPRSTDADDDVEPIPNDRPAADAAANAPEAAAPAQSADAARVAQCGSASTCGASRVFYPESSDAMTSGDPACLVAALGARTPARYEFAHEDYISTYSSRVDIVLVVDAAGGVEVSARDQRYATQGSGQPYSTDEYRPTQRCVLKPPAFFEACAAELAGERPDYACVSDRADSMGVQNLPPWFESCVDAAPTCAE